MAMNPDLPGQVSRTRAVKHSANRIGSIRFARIAGRRPPGLRDDDACRYAAEDTFDSAFFEAGRERASLETDVRFPGRFWLCMVR
jgi:hypothetical protein